jgi:hypothetical protein
MQGCRTQCQQVQIPVQTYCYQEKQIEKMEIMPPSDMDMRVNELS